MIAEMASNGGRFGEPARILTDAVAAPRVDANEPASPARPQVGDHQPGKLADATGMTRRGGAGARGIPPARRW